MPPQNKNYETQEELECNIETDNHSYKGSRNELQDESGKVSTGKEENMAYKWNIWWRMVGMLSYIHAAGLYGAYLLISQAMWATRLYVTSVVYKADLFLAFIGIVLGVLSITAGVHRLWSHRSYKANMPLQLILAFIFTTTFQHSIWYWVRDHRVHHKYSETDADPHNAKRGFFFAHVGCYLLRKHPQVIEKSRRLDYSDLLADKVVMFNDKYYEVFLLLALFITTYIPTLWGENIWTAFFVNWFRIMWTCHSSFSINSFAHLFGTKPYDQNIYPNENLTASFFTIGEGFHNYHHIFPVDYKAAELGSFSFNFTRYFIEVMAAIGWAYDLKTVDRNVVKDRVERTGDGSHAVWGKTKI